MEIEESKEPTPHLLSEEIKWAIVYLKKQEFSNKEVGRMISVQFERPIKHQTVKRIWTLYEETGHVSNRWNTEGRPKALSGEELQALVESCEAERNLSVRERKEDLNLDASRSTINKALLDMGYKAYKVRKKPILTPFHVEDRLAFADTLSEWTVNDWESIVFADESAFRLVTSNGKTVVRRLQEEVLLEENYQAHVAIGPSIMVWGAISSNGVGPLVRLEGNVDAKGYVDALRDRLRRYYPGLYSGEMIFVHDNAPIHTASYTRDWFTKKNIECLEWPSKSPDLNIIENVWGRIKDHLNNTIFDDCDDLWDEIKRVWSKEISTDYISNLYQSLPRRMQAVLDVNGGHTKY